MFGAAVQGQRRCRRVLIACALVLLVLGLTACGSTGPAPVDSRDASGPVPAGYYRVRSGDTLYSIAFRNGVDYRTLARWNKIPPPYRIYTGKLLRVQETGGRVSTKSGEGSAAPAAVSKSARTASAAPAKKMQTAKPAGSGAGATVGSSPGWQWPLRGKVVQTFRSGDRTRQGVRIRGGAGEKVKAAAGGTVVYSGSGLKGYGNLIIVKHDKNYLSAYGFNRRLLVSEGDRVKRGQIVAEVGQAAGGDYLLHFEIRKNGIAQDPLRYLPKSR